MTYLEKIEKAKARLMLEHPYFGTVASSLKLEKNNEILTFSSNGEMMRYNSEYLDRLSVTEVEFMMANGAMHAVLQHQDRTAGRTKWLWQTATDYVVNGMLVKNGMQPPVYANYEAKFEGMYAEEVYEILRSEMMDSQESMSQEEQQITDTDDTTAENLHMQKDLTPSNDTENKEHDHSSDEQEESNSTPDLEELSEELQEHFEQIFQKNKRQGTLPKDMKFLVPEYFSHKIDWREFLYGYIASHAKSNYSFTPPNMKYLYRGIYLPSLSSDLLRIIVAIDTSGSVDETLLSTFLGEVSSMMQQYPNYEIDLITADAKIQSHKVFLPGETLEYEVSGGGGTDFRPVFEFIDQEINYPTLLLYFTDGEGTFPNEEAPYDVLWVMPEVIEVPFGEVVSLDTKEIN
jgi:predicted metal-dependent peptidase